MAYQYRGQVRKNGGAWEELFPTQSTSKYLADASAWPLGTTEVRVYRRDTVTGLETVSDTRTITLIEAPEDEPYLALNGLRVRVAAFRESEPEYGGAGMRRSLSGQLRQSARWTARTWEVDAICITDEESQALHDLAEVGGIDLAMTGRAIPAPAVVRVVVDQDEHASHGRVRLLRLRIREQP